MWVMARRGGRVAAAWLGGAWLGLGLVAVLLLAVLLASVLSIRHGGVPAAIGAGDTCGCHGSTGGGNGFP